MNIDKLKSEQNEALEEMLGEDYKTTWRLLARRLSVAYISYMQGTSVATIEKMVKDDEPSATWYVLAAIAMDLVNRSAPAIQESERESA